MGDLMLYNSGVFNWKEFAKTQNQNLERHLTNYGRYNLSVADSSFDNWLDGYKQGVPNRKTSIYPDAALCMLMVDLEIIKNSNGKYSLHSVMKELYENFALKGKGYSENDFQNICTFLGGHKVSEIFKNHIYGTQDYIPSLMSALNVVGINLKEVKNSILTAQYFGFISAKKDGEEIIMKVEPNSIADHSRIGPEDKIIKINGRKFDLPLNEILNKCGEKVNFTIQKKLSEKEVSLKSGNYYKLLEIVKNKNITKKQLSLRKIWTR
jgi:predicted metalloprotease with PDZ domain